MATLRIQEKLNGGHKQTSHLFAGTSRPAQVCTYGFDARGGLLSMSLTEVTGNGGKITYQPDAIGPLLACS